MARYRFLILFLILAGCNFTPAPAPDRLYVFDASDLHLNHYEYCIGLTLLRRRHGLSPTDDDDFSLRTPEEMATVLTQTTNTMTYLLASVAAVSLLVGGIGIMNIMLVSVTERTKEIGLRRAVGPRRRDVLEQFVVEAMALTLAGGVAGIALGVLGAWTVNQMLNWTTVVSVPAVLMSFTFAAVVRMVFGFFPARRAAGLNPVDALHYE